LLTSTLAGAGRLQTVKQFAGKDGTLFLVELKRVHQELFSARRHGVSVCLSRKKVKQAGFLGLPLFPFPSDTAQSTLHRMNKLYTTDTAAEFLGVTPARVRQLILEGRLKSEKYGRDHLIQEHELQGYTTMGKKKPGRPRKK